MERWWAARVGRAFRYDYMTMVLTIDRLVRESRANDLSRFTGLEYSWCMDLVLDEPSNPVVRTLIAISSAYPGVEEAFH